MKKIVKTPMVKSNIKTKEIFFFQKINLTNKQLTQIQNNTNNLKNIKFFLKKK